MKLYPLKFEHIYKDKIWGGNRFKSILNRVDVPSDSCGESWEISAVSDNISIVANGFLQGNTLEEIIEIYMDEIVGSKVYERFGIEFPLLIKFLDSNDYLSVQVHPNDEVALERHDSFGKTEMWYVISAEKDSELIIGFKENCSPEEFYSAITNNTVENLLHSQIVKQDEAFFLPAGRIHAIGKGLLIAEIQQTSDITYRIFDWNRTDESGNPRELHIEQAIDVIDYSAQSDYKTHYEVKENDTSEIVASQYFTTNLLVIDKTIKKDYYNFDSFVIYMCLEGEVHIDFEDDYSVPLMKGETVLIPAILPRITINPLKKSKILEVYIAE